MQCDKDFVKALSCTFWQLDEQDEMKHIYDTIQEIKGIYHKDSTKQSLDQKMGVKHELENMRKVFPQFQYANKKLREFIKNQHAKLKYIKTPNINEM